MSRPVKIVQGAPRVLVTEAAIGPAPAGASATPALKVALGFAVASRPKPARAPSTASLLHLSLAREPSAPPSVGPRRINDRRKKLNHQHLRQLVLIAQLELVLARRNLKTPWPTSAHSSRPARPRTGSAGTVVLVEVGARLGRPNSYSTRRRAPPSAARPLEKRRSHNSRRRRTRGPLCCRSAGAGPTSSLRRPGGVNCAFRVSQFVLTRRTSRSNCACSLPAHRPRRPPARRTSARPVGSGACTAGCAKNVFGATSILKLLASDLSRPQEILAFRFTHDCSGGVHAEALGLVSQLQRQSITLNCSAVRRNRQQPHARTPLHTPCLAQCCSSSCGRPPRPSESLHQ